LESKTLFSTWLVNFHNLVNKRLRKPEYSYETAKQLYLNDDATCELQAPCGEVPKPESRPSLLPYFLLGGILFLFLSMFILLKRK
jgi:hypothetical protein